MSSHHDECALVEVSVPTEVVFLCRCLANKDRRTVGDQAFIKRFMPSDW